MQKIKALLATGQHNHEWTKSSSFCKTLLEDSALFDVTICKDPSTALQDKTYANSFGFPAGLLR